MATAAVSKRQYPTNTARRPAARQFLPALSTTVGSKFLVALTGLLLTGFVAQHMLGKLLVFKGGEALNSYAKMLKDFGGLLWAARIGLLTVFVLHVGLAVRLKLRSRAARPIPYAHEDVIQASWS